MAKQFTYYNANGESVVLNDESTSYLYGYQGLGLEGVQLVGEQVPYTDGVSHKGLYTPPRTVALMLFLEKDTLSELEAFERAWMAKLNPYIDKDTAGTLRVRQEDGTTFRDLACFLKAYRSVSTDIRRSSKARAIRTLIFEAPDPWFYNPTQQSESFPLPGGGGGSFPLTFGISFASTSTSGYIYPVNNGDIEAWPVIKIDGPADNPVITNSTTGKVMDITYSQDTSDYIEIDMANATVEHYDDSLSTTTSILEYVSAASEFWPLVAGENTIKVECDNSSMGAILLTWYDYYVGV